MLKTLLLAGAMALAFATPASALETFLASDNKNQTPASAANPAPMAALAYNGTGMGYASLTPTTASGLGCAAGSTFAYVIGETTAWRWRDDGTLPTATVGNPVQPGVQVIVTNLAAFKVIQASGSLDVNCEK